MNSFHKWFKRKCSAFMWNFREIGNVECDEMHWVVIDFYGKSREKKRFFFHFSSYFFVHILVLTSRYSLFVVLGGPNIVDIQSLSPLFLEFGAVIAYGIRKNGKSLEIVVFRICSVFFGFSPRDCSREFS